MAIEYLGEGFNYNKDRFMFSYTYNGNDVLTPTAVDTSTGYITVAEDASAISMFRLNAFYNLDVNIPSSTTMPSELAGRSNTGGSLVSGNNIIQIGGISSFSNTGDIGKWHIENKGGIEVSNVFEPNKKYKVVITNLRTSSYLVELDTTCLSTGYNSQNVKGIWGTPYNTPYYGMHTIISNYANLGSTVNVYITNYSNNFIVEADGYGAGYNRSSAVSWTARNRFEYDGAYMQHFNVICGRDPIANGTKLDFYEVFG